MLLAALLACLNVSAKNVEGVSVSEISRVGRQNLVLNGAGVRVKYVVAKVYVGALYLPQKNSDGNSVINANAPRRMVLTMLRDIDVNDLYKSLVEGMQNNSSAATMTALAPQMQQVKQGFASVKDLQKGDVVTMDFTPGKGTTIAVRNKPMGLIAGDNFSHALLAIWLGSNPVQPDLKTELLGG
jgi:hypothetical protein